MAPIGADSDISGGSWKSREWDGVNELKSSRRWVAPVDVTPGIVATVDTRRVYVCAVGAHGQRGGARIADAARDTAGLAVHEGELTGYGIARKGGDENRGIKHGS